MASPPSLSPAADDACPVAALLVLHRLLPQALLLLLDLALLVHDAVLAVVVVAATARARLRKFRGVDRVSGCSEW